MLASRSLNRKGRRYLLAGPAPSFPTENEHGVLRGLAITPECAGMFGKSDPFLVFKRSMPDGSVVKLLTTEARGREEEGREGGSESERGRGT